MLITKKYHNITTLITTSKTLHNKVTVFKIRLLIKMIRCFVLLLVTQNNFSIFNVLFLFTTASNKVSPVFKPLQRTHSPRLLPIIIC
jgi:hypothetical protein